MIVFPLSLTVVDLLPLVCIGVAAFIFYMVLPTQIFLKNYYKTPFISVLLIIHALFCAVAFVAVEHFFLYVHKTSFFALPYLDQGLFFLIANGIILSVIWAALPFFPVKAAFAHEIQILIVRGSYESLFQKGSRALKRAGADVLIELPEEQLIIAQTPETVCEGSDQKRQYVIELTYAPQPLFKNVFYLHILCYPAHRGFFTEEEDMQRELRHVTAALSLDSGFGLG